MTRLFPPMSLRTFLGALLIAISVLAPIITVLGQAQGPSVETLAPTNVSESSAMLWGSVNPNGIPTTWDFADPATGASYCPSPPGLTDASTSAITVNCLASGLTPSTTYQYALRASNRAGSIMGNVVTFTTLSATSTVSAFDFMLSVTPSTLTVIAGGSGTYTVTVSLLSGVTQNVYLSLFGLPAGVTGSFYQPSGYPSFISTLVVVVPSDAQSGSNPLTIVATSGSLVKTASTVLVITASTTTYITQGITTSTAGLYVSSFGTNEVKAYGATTGAFVKTFASGGGLGLPVGLVFGPDGNLYVSSPASNNVLRYNGVTGAFVGVFASGGGLSNPQGMWFGPNGNLYVSSFNTNDVKQYIGASGAFVSSLTMPVGTNCGPEGLVFGPDGNIYVSCSASNGIARFSSTTGGFVDFFVAIGSGGLSNPQGLTFGSDGNLYVSSFNTNQVKRYNVTGGFLGNFATGGGLLNPNGLTFGPDGNLYVSSFGTNEVKRYNGVTGAYIGTFASGGGLVRPTFLTFQGTAVMTTTTTTALTSQTQTTFFPPDFFIEGVEQTVNGVLMPLTIYVRQGETARIQFRIRAVNGFRERVSFELSPSIAGLSASFDPPSGFPDFTSTLTLEVSSFITPNVYRLNILAAGGGITKSGGIGLVVPEPGPTGIATLAGSLPLTTGPNSLRESTAVMIPPGLKPNDCPSGRLLISSGGIGAVVYKDLDKLGGPAQVIFFVYDNSVPPKPPPFGSGLEDLIDDNILVRLTNGDLLLSWEGRGLKTTPPSNMQGSNPSLIQEWKKNNDWARGAIFLWRSSDCGDSWSSLAPIDIATVGDGRCAWPREAQWGGGMDRHEMYVDPWNGNVYVTFQCEGGGANIGPTGGFPPLVSRTYLLTSTNNGDTWSSFMLNDQSIAPSMMTSTPSGRLFIATCTGYRPHIQWLDKPWTSIKGETDVFYLEALGTAPEATAVEHRCAMVPHNGTNYAPSLLPVKTTQAQLTSLSLSRVSDGSFDTVRLAYPGVIYLVQVEHIVAVRVSAAGSVISKFDIGSIHAEELTGSVLQATFVETDRLELGKQDKTTDRVLLYWVETSPSTKSMFARYTSMSGTLAPEPIKDLSVSGKRVTWIPNGEWTGDYMYGGFYSDGTNLNFAPQWPQSGPKGSTNLYFNIIKIPYASATATSSQCLIATASYGSELSPEVQFLREFRDASIMKTRTGSSFMIVFNAWYYSFSPTVAQSIQQPAFKTAMRFLLSPLIEILRIGAAAFEIFPTNPEAGAILSGLTVSALIGVIYITLPLSVILAVTSNGLRRARRLEKTLILLLFGSLVALGLAEVLTVPLLMSVASSLVALSTLFFSALMSSRALLRVIGWYLR